MSEIKDLAKQLAQFSDDRNWGQYHNPKNLIMALTNEIGELVEHFQWRSFEECEQLDDKTKEAVRLELADVFIYLVRLADRLGVDLFKASQDKLVINARKYPATS